VAEPDRPLERFTIVTPTSLTRTTFADIVLGEGGGTTPHPKGRGTGPDQAVAGVGSAALPSAVAFLFFSEAGRILERGQAAAWLRLRRLLAATRRREYRRRADQPAEQERLQAVAPLVAVHATILGVIVCTLGDLLLDVVVRLARPLVPGDDAPSQTTLGPGGQAANVAVWAVELGARARLVAKRADDDTGRLLGEELARRGVEVAGPVVPGRTGVVVSIADAGGERTMASDRGVGATLAPGELDHAWFACDVLHVSGYGLLVDGMAAAAAAAARAARAHGGRVSLDLSTWSAIRELGRDTFRRRAAVLEPDVVFGRDRELDELGDDELAPTVVRKLGPEGAVVGRKTYPARPGPVVDTTGAGDALAAGFLVGGIELGLETAARCVAKQGTMP